MLLSLIIPAYNVEKYLEKCIQSCLSQDLDKSFYEILIVNDGSKDNTLIIAERLASVYDNIKIINQKNGGLSAARNIGLINAKGEYVWFIDSDDYINCNVLKKIYAIAHGNNLDILWLEWQKVDEKGRKLSKDKNWIKNEYTEVVDGHLFLQKIQGMCFYAWAFIFNREFLTVNYLRFKEGVIYEDIEAIPFFIMKANRIKYHSFVVYNYLQRTGSLLHSIQPNVVNSLLFIVDKYEKAIREYPDLNKCLKEIQLFSIRRCLNVVSAPAYADNRKQVFDKINSCKYPDIYMRTSFIANVINKIWRIDESLILLLYRLLFFLK